MSSVESLVNNNITVGNINLSLSKPVPVIAPGQADEALPEGGVSQNVEPSGSYLGSYRISQNFLNYLQKTKNIKFRLKGTNKGESIVKTVPFIHRWTTPYQKSIMAKFYQLENWMTEKLIVVSMFTLTTYQGSTSKFNNGSYSEKIKGHRLSIGECFDLLKESRTKLLDLIRHYYPGINYFWILEPHKTGFPHCHLLLFREFTEAEQTAIKTLWSKKYEAGSFDKGIEITSKNSDDSIKSIRNYLLKYMSKQFGIGDENWTNEELLFNAIVWSTKTRMWGASKELTAVMKKPETKSENVWESIELLILNPLKGMTVIEIWVRDAGEPFPDLCELNPDDLCPEDSTTRRLWVKKYERGNYRDNHTLLDFDNPVLGLEET